MAIVDIGTITIDNTDRTPATFPSISLLSGQGYIHLLDLQPVSLVPDFVYYIVSPYILFGGNTFELQRPFKWYPRGSTISFVVPLYQAGGTNLSVGIAIVPIPIFPNRASPESVLMRLRYEDAFVQPIAFGL